MSFQCLRDQPLAISTATSAHWRTSFEDASAIQLCWMNHIPDTVLTSIDEFGEQLLVGEPITVRGTLRADLRLEITPTDDTAASCRYETTHTRSPPTLRDRGSFVTTIIDGIDTRLESWGITPPTAYTYTTTVSETHRYEGTLQLP